MLDVLFLLEGLFEVGTSHLLDFGDVILGIAGQDRIIVASNQFPSDLDNLMNKVLVAVGSLLLAFEKLKAKVVERGAELAQGGVPSLFMAAMV